MTVFATLVVVGPRHCGGRRGPKGPCPFAKDYHRKHKKMMPANNSEIEAPVPVAEAK